MFVNSILPILMTSHQLAPPIISKSDLSEVSSHPVFSVKGGVSLAAPSWYHPSLTKRTAHWALSSYCFVCHIHFAIHILASKLHCVLPEAKVIVLEFVIPMLTMVVNIQSKWKPLSRTFWPHIHILCLHPTNVLCSLRQEINFLLSENGDFTT